MKKIKNNNVKMMVLTAILMSLTLISKLLFYFIQVFNGYGIELYLVFYVYGLILIKDLKWQLTFGLITPWFLLVLPPDVVNFQDLLFEYILALYIFLPFIAFAKFIDWSNKLPIKRSLINFYQMGLFALCFITIIFIKLFIHTLAGYWWWTPGDLYGSFIFNLPIYMITLAVALPVGLAIYFPLMKLRQSTLV